MGREGPAQRAAEPVEVRAAWRDQGWQLVTSSPTATQLYKPQNPIRTPPRRAHAGSRTQSQACGGKLRLPGRRGASCRAGSSSRAEKEAQCSSGVPRPSPGLPSPSSSLCLLPTPSRRAGKGIGTHRPKRLPTHPQLLSAQLAPGRPLGPCQRPSNLRGRKRLCESPRALHLTHGTQSSPQACVPHLCLHRSASDWTVYFRITLCIWPPQVKLCF